MITDEQWRPVVGYEDFYEVSDTGRVRRNAPGANTWVGRVLKPILGKRRYLVVHLSARRARKRVPIHTLVASAFIGPCPHDQEVNHRDRCRANNVLANLEYKTHPDNVEHAAKLGAYRGESNGSAILTESQVVEIRSALKTGTSRRDLSARFGVK